MEDKEILDYSAGGQKIHDMTCMGFLGWVAGKLNGVTSFSGAAVELRGMVQQPPIARTMADAEKIRIFRLLEKAGAQV